MTNWRFVSAEPVESYALPGEGSELYSPVGLRLIDDFTGRPPLVRVRAALERRDDAGLWQATDILAAPNASGILTYPGLGRCADAVGVLPRRYRVRLSAELYRPMYRMRSAGPVVVPEAPYDETAEGIEFDSFPYDASRPPTDYRGASPVEMTPQVHDVKLSPAVNYPFPSHVRVVHGQVVVGSTPVIDAEVNWDHKERVLSGEQGYFSLPLRWAPNASTTPLPTIRIDAFDHRANLTGNIQITLPDALGSKQTIIVA